MAAAATALPPLRPRTVMTGTSSAIASSLLSMTFTNPTGMASTSRGRTSPRRTAAHKALRAVIDEATRLYKAGVPVDDAIKQAQFGEYASWTLASSQAPIAVRKVYEELSGRLK